MPDNQVSMSAGVFVFGGQVAFSALILVIGVSNGVVLVVMAPSFIDIFGVQRLPVAFGWLGGAFNGVGGLIICEIAGLLLVIL